MKTKRSSCHFVVWLLTLAAPACGAPDSAHEIDETPQTQAVSSTSGPACITASLATCAQAEQQEDPPPPPPGPEGCTVVVVLEEVAITSGQGISEGDLEMNVVASSGGASLRWPSVGERLIEPGRSKDVNRLVTEYALAPRERKTIEVCATVTEDDNGGLNGDDDVGSGCADVTISCRMLEQLVNIPTALCVGNDLADDGSCKQVNGSANTVFRVSHSDEDGDGVSTPDDATPTMDSEACRGQKGHGVIVFMEFGDSDLNEIVGAVGIGIDQLVAGYDWVGIAVEPTSVAGFTLRADTLAKANMVEEPTQDGLLRLFKTATSRGFDMTTFVLAHGGADVSGDTYFTSLEGLILESSLDHALSLPVAGTCAFPFRAVTSLACYFGHMNEMWLRRGSHVASGPKFTNFYPQELNGFGRSWNGGADFGNSVANAANSTVRFLNSAAIDLVANVTTGCSTVLQQSACAEDFFTTDGPSSMSFAGNGRNDYDASVSGAQNMTEGSLHLVAGDTAVVKGSALTW